MGELIRLSNRDGKPMDDEVKREGVRPDSFDRFKWLNGWSDDPEVKGTTVAVLNALFRRMGSDGECYPSVPGLADLAGLHRRTVQRHVRVAVRLGWLKVIKRKGQRHTYVATHPGQSATGGTESPQGRHRVTRGTESPVAERHPGGGTESQGGGTAPPEQSTKQSIEQSKASDDHRARAGQPTQHAGATDIITEVIDAYESHGLLNDNANGNAEATKLLTALHASDIPRRRYLEYVLDECRYQADRLEEDESSTLRDARRFVAKSQTMRKWLEVNPATGSTCGPASSRAFRQTDYANVDYDVEEVD